MEYGIVLAIYLWNLQVLSVLITMWFCIHLELKKVSFVNYEIKSFPQNKGYIEFNCTNAAKALLGVYKG